MAESSNYTSFHRAYLVAVDQDSRFIGVVRKEGPGWVALLLGVPENQQPTDRFVTRREAAEHLLQMAAN
jgi:hypothetical protein